MHGFIQDICYTLRRLHKSPAFTLTAVLTLAVGIGATTIMFSFVENVLLRPLPYENSQQLVAIRETISTPKADFSDLPVNANHLTFWQAHNRSFTGIAAFIPESMPIGGGETEEIRVAQITANLPSVLGFQPRLGRTFTRAEEQPNHDAVLLTDGLWRQRYGANPGIVGQTITLDGRQYLVTGVLPSEFAPPVESIAGTGKPIEALVPFGWSSEQLAETEGDHNYFAVGRLKPGVNLPQARSDLDAMQRLISRETPDKVRLGVRVLRYQEYLTGSGRESLLLLLVAVSGLLVIACINVANLLLARMAGRQHESCRLSRFGSHARAAYEKGSH